MSEIVNNDPIKKEEPIQEQPIQNTPEIKEEAPTIKSEENQANWRRFREERDKQRKEKEEAEKIAKQKQLEAEALRAALEAALEKQNPTRKNQYDEEESEENIIEKKVQQALEKERQRLRQEQQALEAQTYPQRLVQTYADFNHVCSTENLDYLDFHYPEVTAGYKHMPDGFEKWSAVYQSVKKLVPQIDKKDQGRIEKNLLKPQAVVPQLTDTNPQTSGWKLTEERRKENWRRMQKDLKSFKTAS